MTAANSGNQCRMKILIVGTYDERRNGALFYSTTRKLANGLTRLGHNVWGFSDREIVRSEAPFGIRPIGAALMNRRLLETVENFRPDIMLLCHADTISRTVLRRIRERPSPPLIALRNLDPMYITKNVENVRRYQDLVDAIFVTTAGETLRQFSGPGRIVAFMPNPVDRSIESYRAFDQQADFDLFFATRVNKHTDRVALFDELKRRMPSLRVDHHGFNGRPPLVSAEFFERMARCRMGWNLNRQEYAWLYSSDRMAQYIGNGLLVLMDRATGFDTIFGEDEIGFHTGMDELVARIAAFTADDALARAVAAKGHAKAHALFDSTRVARWVLEATLRQTPSEAYGWPTETY